jgi:hypothetical protein
MLKIDGFASLLLRANALAKGTSGARVGLVEAILACLNGDVLPQVPSRGSVGASGDLAHLAQARPSADRGGPGVVRRVSKCVAVAPLAEPRHAPPG